MWMARSNRYHRCHWQSESFGSDLCDVLTDADGRGGAGGGSVEDVDHARGGDDAEIVDERAVALQRLSADAGAAGGEVCECQIRDEALQGREEGALTQRAIHLAEAG